MTDYLDQISRFAAETAYEDIPAGARAAGCLILLDTLGGMLAGSTLPESQGFARLAAAEATARPCTLVGFAFGAAAPQAAMVNAATACAMETDEGNRLGGGHPAIHVVPAALARAEELRASGRELLRALVIGYEVMSRLAAGASARWPVHSHGTHGSPGSAVAAALYQRPDAARLRRLINLAACMSPATTWQVCFDGGTVRNLYPAISCMLGMLAVDLEAVGYRGSNDGPADVFGGVFGHGVYKPERVLDGLGEQWRVTTNYFKLHYACAFTAPPLDALAAILDRRPVAADAVERITVQVPPVSAHLAGFWPSNMLSAKFNIPYVLAATIVRGSAGIESFLDEARADPEIRALAQRVDVIPEQERKPRLYGDPLRSRVTLALRSGEQLSAEAAIPRGDALNPAPRAQLLQKFRQLAALRLEAAATEAIIDRVMHLAEVADVATLGPLLRPPSPAADLATGGGRQVL